MIRRSMTEEIRELIGALGGDDDVRREAAIARLRVIGAVATDRLVRAYETADRDARLGILRALETTSDPRAVPIGVRAVADGGDVAAAGVAMLVGFLDAPDSDAAAAALDALMTLALDRGAAGRERLAAIDALGAVPEVTDRLAMLLRSDATLATPPRDRDAAASDAAWRDALEGTLPDVPSVLRDAVATHAAATPPGTLRTLVERVRDAESRARSGRRRDEWRVVRGALHQALALGRSRIALYDIRETLEAATEPLPASFLAALHAAGDASCLDAVAAAYVRARPDEARWRHQLVDVFQAIVARERLTRRHAAVRRIGVKWPDAAPVLTGETRPRTARRIP